MSKTTLILTIFCLVLLGALGYFYYKYEYSVSIIEYSNLSISAEENGRKIKTGFIIETQDGNILGNTSKSYEMAKVRIGDVIKIYNKNIEDQNFYTDVKEFEMKPENRRVKLTLEKPKEIIVKINKTKPIKIFLKSEDARNIDFCISWSANYIFVEALNFTEIDKIDGWSKCYDGNFSLINSNKTIEIKYTKFGTPDDKDYIKLLLLLENMENTETINIL